MKYLLLLAVFLSTACFAAEYQLPERTLIGGIIFKKGTTLVTSPNGYLDRGTLETITFNNGLFWSADAEVTFFPDDSFDISSGKLSLQNTDQKVVFGDKTMFLAAGSNIWMMQQDRQRPRMFTISKDAALVAGVIAANTAIANTEIQLNDDYSMRMATLKVEFDYRGYKFSPSKSAFYPGGAPLSLGKLRNGTLSIDGIFKGVILPAGANITFEESGEIEEIFLSRSAKFADVVIPANSRIVFQSGRITQAFLGGDLQYKGKTFLANQYVPFSLLGEPYVPQTK